VKTLYEKPVDILQNYEKIKNSIIYKLFLGLFFEYESGKIKSRWIGKFEERRFKANDFSPKSFLRRIHRLVRLVQKMDKDTFTDSKVIEYIKRKKLLAVKIDAEDTSRTFHFMRQVNIMKHQMGAAMRCALLF